MPLTAIVGTQWGDEGKGKIVDLLSERSDVVARYQGGANAGHTVVVSGRQTILHLVPSGILHPNTICVIGNGVVVDPWALVAELERLAEDGISADGRLYISHQAHVVLPYHRQIDQLSEHNSDERIGTTGRGIGPAYVDKFARCGLRMHDLLDTTVLREKLRHNVQVKNRLIAQLQGKPIDFEEVLAELLAVRERLVSFVRDTSSFMAEAIAGGKRILAEGAQGTLLDVDFGTYPFVTSSNPVSGGVCTGLGIGPKAVDRVLGVAKAYVTRVGNGPLPTEFPERFAAKVREWGGEYGATTGRPRRCGWFDAVVARYAARVNGLDAFVITKLDVLDNLESIKVCVAYEVDGERIDHFPGDCRVLEKAKPVFEEFPGWGQSTSAATNWADLPPAAQNYLKALEELSGAPVAMVSVGWERKQTVVLREDLLP